MSSRADFDVLLAVHNGEEYLLQQLLSLKKQSLPVAKLLVLDSFSKDDSWSLLNKWAVVYKEHCNVILSMASQPLSAKENFTQLLELSQANYIAFCDQDDIWHHDKMKLEISEMQRLEALYPGKPIVVHSDLEVVDAELNTLALSFFDSQRLPRAHESKLDQLVLNNVTGCTMLINRAARNLALPIPPEAIMHDWWIAAKVRYHGGIISLVDRPLVKYRQHGNNVVGASRISFWYFFCYLMVPWRLFKSWQAIYRQAKAIDNTVTPWDVAWRKLILTLRRSKY